MWHPYLLGEFNISGLWMNEIKLLETPICKSGLPGLGCSRGRSTVCIENWKEKLVKMESWYTYIVQIKPCCVLSFTAVTFLVLHKVTVWLHGPRGQWWETALPPSYLWLLLFQRLLSFPSVSAQRNACPCYGLSWVQPLEQQLHTNCEANPLRCGQWSPLLGVLQGQWLWLRKCSHQQREAMSWTGATLFARSACSKLQ